MRLTWGEYLDYEDPVWQERKAYLEEIRQRFSKEAAGFDTAELLDYLEQLEELLRYYTFVRDFQSLEPLMRYYEPLLGILEGRYGYGGLLVSGDGVRQGQWIAVS